jgi:hypothetical protein
VSSILILSTTLIRLFFGRDAPGVRNDKKASAMRRGFFLPDSRAFEHGTHLRQPATVFNGVERSRKPVKSHTSIPQK